MKLILAFGLVGFLFSCGALKDNCGADIEAACGFVFGKNNEPDIQSLQEQIDSVNDILDAQDTRIAMLEYITKLNRALIDSNTLAFEELVIPSLDEIEQLIYEVQIEIDSEIDTIKLQLTELYSQIQDLEETAKRNDEYVNIPGCEHSYFVLYKADKSIVSVYVTENDGTVGGSWLMQHNKIYSLLIDNVVTCTGVRYNKNDKKLYYNNGVSSFISLGY